ncbi:MAG TPA: IS1182 family transposase [Streptomyces sp.]|nr:IS1182 family transposase [Streptomyces sp.]
MSLRPGPVPPVPAETARVARAAFPKGNPYLRMRDEVGAIYEDAAFAHLFPARGQPAAAPWRLALVTIFQFAEDLSDRQAADAVRGRIDWKYALSLELTDAGFDHTVLSEFRGRLVEGGAERLLLDVLLRRFRELGLLRARGRQRTDSTHVLAAVRALNRLELVREALRHALDVLAEVAPGWLSTHARPDWVKRYQRRSDEYRLPKGKEAQRELADQIGRDGMELLEAAHTADAASWLREVPAVEMLRRIWVQNYLQTEGGVRFRTAEDGLPPAAQFVSSPHDADAHLGKKGSTCWVGYKVALTETCEDDLPNLLTHVATTPAPTADGEVTPQVHTDLQEKGLLPAVHLVDTGFLDAELLVESRRQYGVDLLGPTRKDQRWQARAGEGFGIEHFAVDFERRTAVCPEGHESAEWVPRVDNRGNDSVYIRFSAADCGPCPSRAKCTRSRAKHPRRSIAVRPAPQYEALRQRRAFEASAEYAHEYARRAGVEGTISQGTRRCGLRRSRYVGLAKTHLGHALTATALDFVRVADWLAGVARAHTRPSRFAILMARPL